MGPFLAAIEPLAQGVDQGVTAGATNINAAVRNAGQAVNQAAQGVGDAAQGVTQGAGETVAEVPGAADRTVFNVERTGLVGNVIDTAFGAPGQKRHLKKYAIRDVCCRDFICLSLLTIHLIHSSNKLSSPFCRPPSL